MAMDWKLAIETNRDALMRIVAGLVALLSGFEGVLRLPRSVHQHLGLNLHKAEAALRRLIVIAARGLVVPPSSHHPMPEGLIIAGHNPNGPSRRVFQLFDARVIYSFEEREIAPNLGPLIHYIDDASLHAKFPSLLGRPPVELSSAAETTSLRLRLAAAARALQNLTREAKRMARWQARRKQMDCPKFTSPIRPGPPPGNSRSAKADIDLVLRECHGLARDALKLDSS